MSSKGGPIESGPIESGPIESGTVDVAVVGGGICGAWIAYDAALRGLDVVLFERDDFGAATSAASQRILHGGLRYLQHGDVGRVVESTRERATLLAIAPELTRVLPFVVPVAGGMTRAALSAALRFQDALARRERRRAGGGAEIPKQGLLTERQCVELCPALGGTAFGVGALLFDGQIERTERMVVAVLRAAVNAGARIHNHCEVRSIGRQQNGRRRVAVRDTLDGREGSVQARLVVNAAGPWVGEVLRDAEGDVAGADSAAPKFFDAYVLALPPLAVDVAVGLRAAGNYRDRSRVLPGDGRLLFATPWRGATLVGTFHRAWNRETGDGETPGADEIEKSLEEIGRALKGSVLAKPATPSDVLCLRAGRLPLAAGATAGSSPYEKRDRILDRTEAGLLTVVGVKYTTARALAERVVNKVERSLGRSPSGCLTSQRPLPTEGEETDLAAQIDRVVADEWARTEDDVIRRLGLDGLGPPEDRTRETIRARLGRRLGA